MSNYTIQDRKKAHSAFINHLAEEMKKFPENSPQWLELKARRKASLQRFYDKYSTIKVILP